MGPKPRVPGLNWTAVRLTDVKSDMIVGSWPGYAATQNDFLRIFLDGLAGAGCEIRSIDSVDDLSDHGDLDVVMIHWPQRVFWEANTRWGALRNKWILISALRNMSESTVVVMVAHNLRPHDAEGLMKWLWRPFMSILIAELDGFITLSPETVAQVHDAYPRLVTRASSHFRHPKYPGQVLTAKERLLVRSELRSQKEEDRTVRVVGYCGQLRKSKGLDALIGAFGEEKLREHRLLIAGLATASNADLVARLEAAARRDERIYLELADLSAERYRELLGACDLIVAPFRNYLHSGSIVHALSANRPVLTPRTPFAEGLVSDLGPSWVRLYDGELTSKILLDALSTSLPAGDCPLEDYESKVVGCGVAGWLRGQIALKSTDGDRRKQLK